MKNSRSTEYFIKKKQKRNKNSGIKLLSTSKKFITTKEITKLFVKHKKELRYTQIKEDSSLLKFQEAAIDPECILNKSDIVWNSEYSEPEFKYKQSKDGILIEAYH